MPHYQHDMMHCRQEQCAKKDQCYRYWLGKELKDYGSKHPNLFCYASFYHPDEPVVDGCEHFLNIKDY